jgi:glycosyltransferase involved in cell wall biosynthesis
LLCVSRLIELKFPDDAVRALASARQAGHDVRLVFAGDGDLRAKLAALADELDVAGRVIFAGNLDQAALAQLYANVGVVVSPLTGRALSEAALGAAPIVAYDLDWQRDLIRTGKTGELVPFRDQSALGDAVVRLLSDRDHARAVGAAARAAALEMFDENKILANERAAYSSLLEKKR